MDLKLDFIHLTSGLEVSFRIISKVPAKSSFDWDFGDDKGEYFNIGRHPSHSYEAPGFYTVTVHVTNSSGLDITFSKNIIVCNYGHTVLTDSIYNLIDHYIPEELSGKMSREDKDMYISKWQFYIGPLVNHIIPKDKYRDELWYEALENQLIMELAAWDFLNVRILNLLSSTSEYLSQITTTKESSDDLESVRGDKIKQITTGPTEVQYYDQLADSVSSLWKNLSNAMKPGGMIDELRKNLCMLASRLEIYLPFCTQIYNTTIPRVVNRRQPGPLDGPNPTAPIYGPIPKLVE